MASPAETQEKMLFCLWIMVWLTQVPIFWNGGLWEDKVWWLTTSKTQGWWAKGLGEYEYAIAKSDMEKHAESLNYIYHCLLQGINAQCYGSTQQGVTNIASLRNSYQSLLNTSLKSKYIMYI